MSDQQYNRDRGRLFASKDKPKPSAPDLKGKAAIGGVPYEMRGWRRKEQITLELSPAGKQGKSRGRGKVAGPADAFKGALVPAPEHDHGDGASWVGDVARDDVTYTVRAFDEQGKSGKYLSLFFA